MEEAVTDANFDEIPSVINAPAVIKAAVDNLCHYSAHHGWTALVILSDGTENYVFDTGLSQAQRRHVLDEAFKAGEVSGE